MSGLLSGAQTSLRRHKIGLVRIVGARCSSTSSCRLGLLRRAGDTAMSRAERRLPHSARTTPRRPRDCAASREQKLADGGYYICTFCRDTLTRQRRPNAQQENQDAPKP